jgi:succinylglutamate desuccinylase
MGARLLETLTQIPSGLLDRAARTVHEVLAGPTLIHLEGRRPEPLFVSVLLHGNEDTGWEAIRQLLQRYRDRELPRALSLFIGNVAAARENRRFLAGQPDFNRIWEDQSATAHLPERAMTRQIVADMAARGVFAAIDIHNNTGLNPHYACVRRLDHHHLHLAVLFGRTVVYFETPAGVQTAPFAALCPAVTIEAGKPGQRYGEEHVMEYVDAALHLSRVPDHPVSANDIDLYHTVAVCKIPESVSFGFGDGDAELRFVPDLDHLNFRELPVGTTLARASARELPIRVRDENGRDVSERYFVVEEGEVRTRVPVMPSMLTASVEAVRQDCLCYLMERYPVAEAGQGRS